MTASRSDRPTARPRMEMIAEPSALAAFDELHASGVRCCLWKGTVRLERNLDGGGDLDLLVHADDLPRFRRILARTGWQRSRPTAGAAPNSEDHFLVDGASGRLVHLDATVHLRPDGFARDLPGIWRELLLEGRRINPAGVPVPDPAVEAALLLVRLTRQAVPITPLLQARRPRPLVERRRELAELASATSGRAILSVLEVALPDRAIPAATDALAEPSRRNLARLGRRIDGPMAPARASLRQARPTARRLVRGANDRWFHRDLATRRTFPGGGLIVAVVGSDGSGKSSLVERLATEHASKFNTLTLYLGSGDGPASFLRLPLKIARDVLRPAKDDRTPSDQPPRRPPTLARAAWALSLAREKRRRLDRAQRARSRGFLVIADRWPQTQIHGENDGPLLAAWSDAPSPILRRLAVIERHPYDLAAARGPDLVLRLDVDPTTAHRRRPGSTESYLARRAALARSLTWDPATTQVVPLDANAPADEVFRLACLAIWMAR